MAAPQILPVLGSVALSTVGRGQSFGDLEASMGLSLLPLLSLMAVQAGDSGLGVPAGLELMHHRRGLTAVALRALARGANQRRLGLPHLDSRTQAVDHEGGHDQRSANDHGNKDRAKRHGWSGPEAARQVGWAKIAKRATAHQSEWWAIARLGRACPTLQAVIQPSGGSVRDASNRRCGARPAFPEIG